MARLGGDEHAVKDSCWRVRRQAFRPSFFERLKVLGMYSDEGESRRVSHFVMGAS
jgi:hypothetical protein